MKIKVFELASIDITLYKFVTPLMLKLKSNGFDVICGAKNYGYLEKIEEAGIKTYDIAMSRNLNPINIVKSIFSLMSILKKENINILHVHTPIAAIVGRVAAQLAGIDIKIYTVHGFILEPKPFFLIEKFMARFFTSYIFTVNQEDLDLAINNNFIEKSYIRNINSVGINTEIFNPNNIDINIVNNLKQTFKISDDTKIIGYVGRLVKPKGVLDLINSFIEVKKQYSCKLMLVGPYKLGERKSESIIDDIHKLIKKHNLVDDIILTGHIEDMPEILSIIDIFVLPSEREGMPVSLLEAMAMEKAVIGTNIRGIREEITKESGLLYNCGDTSALKDHILYYLNHSEKAHINGKNARIRVINEFDQNDVIQKQLNIFMNYKSLLLSRGA